MVASSRISDVEIWRAAHQLLKQYPEEPDMVAAQRADADYEQGDIFNFNLWTRIMGAVQALLRTRPDGETLN
jgi:hypothetical protein